MRRFNIRQVEAFRAVVTLGSMTKAAGLLGISQPAVSRLMLDFQDAVGFKLFLRQRGGAEPTEDARRLFAQVDRLFLGLEELNQEVHAIKNLSTGRISVAAMGLYANGLLPEIIAKFNKRCPNIMVSLESLPQDRVLDWVASRRSDLGFTTLPIANSSIGVWKLLSRPAMCVFQSGHEFESKRTIDAKDLAERPFVSFPRGTPFRFEIDSLFERAGIERVMKIEATTHEAVCNLVGAGLGLSIVSPYSPHLKRSPELVFRPFTPIIPIELGMVGEQHRFSTAAKEFFDAALDFVAAPKDAVSTGNPSRRSGAPIVDRVLNHPLTD